MWIFGWRGASGFSANSTAEQVTQGIDGSGLTAIVTGGSSGLGTETCRVLALRGVHVIMAVRNVQRGKKVKEDIIKKIPDAKIDIMELELSSLESVRKFASQYNSSGLPLNILMDHGCSFRAIKRQHRVAIRNKPYRSFSLTNLLLDNMKRTAHNCQKEGRIVNVSSYIHHYTYKKGILLDKINDSSSYNSLNAYGQSKLANMLHANELTRRFKEEGVQITANSLHPGLIPANNSENNGSVSGLVNYVVTSFLKNIAQGAATQCYIALNAQVDGVSGEYFVDNNIGKPSALAKDADLAKKLWDLSLKLTGIQLVCVTLSLV